MAIIEYFKSYPDFKTYVMENWDGWPLHTLIACLLMWPIISNSYPLLMFFLNVIFWPMREAWQHGGIHKIWKVHIIIEWCAPIIGAGLMLLLLG